MTLPLVVSLPHAGWSVPAEAAPYCKLTAQQIARDGDEGAAAIYAISDQVAAFVTTPVARAIVDMNRAADDRRADGIIKTHTCWNEPIYDPALPEAVAEDLIARYHTPYHRQLSEAARSGVTCGVDCHTMAAAGPPIGPDLGQQRPWICLSHAGFTCPDAWLDRLAACFAAAFEHEVAVNTPFQGGHIIRAHAAELPWVQIELSRAPFMPDAEKRQRVLAALSKWCAGHTG